MQRVNGNPLGLYRLLNFMFNSNEHFERWPDAEVRACEIQNQY